MPLIRKVYRLTDLMPKTSAYKVGTTLSLTGGYTTPVPLDVISATATAGWSMSRPLKSTWTSPLYTELASEVMEIADQTGNSRPFIQAGPTTRAHIANVGPNSRASAVFNGTTDYMETGKALSNFVTATSKFMIISAQVTSISLNNANLYQNHGLLSDMLQFSGIYLRNPASLTVGAHNWDGNADSSTLTTTYNVPHVFTLRHEGGVLYFGIDGTETAGTATGATTTMTNQLRLFMNGGGTTWAGSFFEGATFSTVPSPADRTTLINNFKEWLGI